MALDKESADALGYARADINSPVDHADSGARVFTSRERAPVPPAPHDSDSRISWRDGDNQAASLRPVRERDESERDWRARPLQPVVFEPLDRVGEDRVHLHLEHPLVQRLLSRFLSQGYGAHDLSRVTIVPSDKDHVVRVVAFARISLFGNGATRLHDAVLQVAAQWLENRGEGHLRPFAEAAESRAVTQLDDLFGRGGPLPPVPERIRERVLKTASHDFGELWKHLIIKDELDRALDARVDASCGKCSIITLVVRFVFHGPRSKYTFGARKPKDGRQALQTR